MEKDRLRPEAHLRNNKRDSGLKEYYSTVVNYVAKKPRVDDLFEVVDCDDDSNESVAACDPVPVATFVVNKEFTPQDCVRKVVAEKIVALREKLFNKSMVMEALEDGTSEVDEIYRKLHKFATSPVQQVYLEDIIGNALKRNHSLTTEQGVKMLILLVLNPEERKKLLDAGDRNDSDKEN